MPIQPLQILLAGTPHTTVMVGEALLGAGHNIVAVFCPFPKPYGRKKIVTATEIERWARAKNIPVINVNRESFQNVKFLEQLPPADVLVVADFGYLIPGWLLNYPKHGGLNIHPSLLPRWRGATPVPFTLLFGDEKTGVTIIKMNEQFDKGEIVALREVELAPDETTPTLLAKAFGAGAKLLAEILPEYISGKLKPTPQDAISPTPTTQKFTKDDGFVSLDILQACLEGKTPDEPAMILAKYSLETNAQSVDRMVRALTPWPGVWTILPNGLREKILQTKIQNGKLEILLSQVEGKTPAPGFSKA